MKKLSIVIPCFNEEETIKETCARLLEIMTSLQKNEIISLESEMLFVDDGSHDKTWEIIEELSEYNTTIKGIKLSRNHGHQYALLAGLLNNNSDITISMDADLQDDINIIPKMIMENNNGAEIVYAVRSKRKSDTLFKKYTAALYYKTLKAMGVEIIQDHADFRLLSKKAIIALAEFKESNLFLRGVIPLLGFKSKIVYYERNPRFAGETKYPIRKMASFAIDGVTSLSSFPLKAIMWAGVIISLISTLIGIWALSEKIFGNSTIPGWASTVVPLYFLGGIQMFSLGIIGGYLSKIYKETKGRPRFIIEKTTRK